MQTHSQGDELKSTSHGMWLLEFFVPSDSMRNLIGDFTEEYSETVNGEPVARMEFWFQLISAIGFYLKEFCELRGKSIATAAMRLLFVALATLVIFGPHGIEPNIQYLLEMRSNPDSMFAGAVKQTVMRNKTKSNKANRRSGVSSSDSGLVSTASTADECRRISDRSFICRIAPNVYMMTYASDDGNYSSLRVDPSLARGYFTNGR